MIQNLWKGFNIFGKKDFFKIFFAYVLFGAYSFFILNYIDTKLNILDFSNINFVNYTQYIINTLGIDLLWLILSILGLILFLVFLTTTIANTENKTPFEFFEGFEKSFKYSSLFILLGIVFLILISILGSYINIFTTILIILLVIIGLMLVFMFFIGNIFLGLFNITVKEALEKARGFVRKKFWTTFAFLILIFIINYLLFLIIDFIYFNIFYYNSIAAIISIEIYYFISSLYIINAFTLFIKEKRFS